jgi:hypothetical protein
MILIDHQCPEITQFFEETTSEDPDLSCICQGYSGLRHLEGSELSAIRMLRRELSEYGSTRSLGRLIDMLPAKEICDQLWEAFMNTVYPLIPVLHLPTFYSQYDGFWFSVEEFRQQGALGGFLASCPTFLALLFSTLFCGSFHRCFIPSRYGGSPFTQNESERQQSKDMYRATMYALTSLGFPRDATLYSLAAFVIWHVPLIREETEHSTAFVSTAFRVGQALGLHRDPKHFKAADIEAEMRRRLWWHILHKDTRIYIPLPASLIEGHTC